MPAMRMRTRRRFVVDVRMAVDFPAAELTSMRLLHTGRVFVGVSPLRRHLIVRNGAQCGMVHLRRFRVRIRLCFAEKVRLLLARVARTVGRLRVHAPILEATIDRAVDAVVALRV